MKKTYDYDENSYKNNNTNKKIIIIFLLVLAIILTIILLNSCSKKDNIVEKFDYEKTLLEAGKKYYQNNKNKFPDDIGQCTSIELNKLISLGLVKQSDFKTCSNETYVSVCKLEDKTYHYTPWLNCTDKKSDTEYNEEFEGNLNDVVKDSSLIRFMFLPQELNEEVSTTGDYEEVWEDEFVDDGSYLTVGKTNYYRYKDEQYIWKTEIKTYYSIYGATTNSASVKDVYSTTPNSKYDKKEAATSYKWYSVSGKEYKMTNGAKDWSNTGFVGYPVKDESSKIDVYSYPPITYHICSKSNNTGNYIYTINECSDGYNDLGTIKSCNYGTDTEIKEYTSSENCTSYDPEIVSACTKKTIKCDGYVSFYNWYKEIKDYYSSKNGGLYFTSAPISGLLKDESTKTTLYKWYYAKEGQTTEYYSEKPTNLNATTKTDIKRYTEWTEWSVNEPEEHQEYRTIEKRVKLKVQKIENENKNNYKDLTENYMSLDDMIKFLNEKEFTDINKLSDISSNSKLNYKVKMIIRNKKKGVDI